MTIQVVSRGNKRAEDRTYRNHCMHCGSLLQFKASDAATVMDRNEAVLVINCPVCKHQVFTSQSAYQRESSPEEIDALARRQMAGM